MRSVAGILILSISLAACSTTSPDDPLVVYSGRSEDLVGPLFTQFTQDTGIELDVRYGDSTELAATLILEDDNSPADMFFSQDPASIGSVAQAGLLAELAAETLNKVPATFSDTDGHWVGVSGRARIVIYNPDTLAAPLPNSIWDLTDPAFEGLAIAPTNGSFLAFVAAMILLEGEDRTQEWLAGIAANNPISYSGNSPIVAAADTGEISLGLVNHYYLLRLDAEQGSTTAQNHFLSAGDAGSLVMPSGLGQLATSERTDDVKQLIDFLLGDEAQQYFADETFEYPLAPGIPANANLVPLDAIQAPALDLSRLSEFLDRATELVTEAGLI